MFTFAYNCFLISHYCNAKRNYHVILSPQAQASNLLDADILWTLPTPWTGKKGEVSQGT